MIRIVHELRRVRGSKLKVQILEQHKENYDWLKALHYMYDTSKNYFVSPPNDFTFPENIKDYSGMFAILDTMSSGEIRGHKLKKLAMDGSSQYGEIFRLILEGSLKAGVAETLINKVYGDLIPTFPLMLAEDCEIEKFPVYASTKYDGVRVLVFVENGIPTPRTRAGKLLPVISLIQKMRHYPDGVYDGELVLGDGLQNDRTGITGYVNRVLKASATDIPGYSFVIFDYVDLESWKLKSCDYSYIYRLSQLNDFYSSDESIRIIQNIEINSASEIESLYKDRIDKGYEGLILRYMDDGYVWARSKKLIKKKAKKDCVLRCIGVKPGTGKYEGLVGSLLCEGIVDGLEVSVNVGSGLSAFDVEQDFSYYVGHKIEIVYNDIVKSDNNQKHSLFLPRFKRRQKDLSI